MRPHILLEFIYTDVKFEPKLYRHYVNKDTLGNAVDHPTKLIYCVSIDETLSEKWVALLRRISNIEHGEAHDNTLIRHLYDIDKITSSNLSIDDNFAQIN